MKLQVHDAIILITIKAFHQNLQVMFKSLLFLMWMFLIKKKKPKGMISQLMHKSFQRMINTTNKDTFVFWSFLPFSTSRNHLTTERHVFSLEVVLKTFSDYDFRAKTGPILREKSQKKTLTRKSTSWY